MTTTTETDQPITEETAAPVVNDAPMKFDVRYEALANALTIAMRVVPAKSSLPVPTNVLVTAEPSLVTVTANNLDVAVRCTMPATVWEPGATTIPARLLSDYLAELSKNDSVTFDYNTKTHKIALTTGRYKANISTIDAEDFPAVPTSEDILNSPDGRQPLSLPAGVLRYCIGLTAYAAATDDTRPVLAAVLVRMDDDGVTMAAADGFRLAAATRRIEHHAQPDKALVPADVLRMIERLLPDEEGESATVAFSPIHLYFESGDVQVFARLIQGEFPDYPRIIPNPEERKASFVANRVELLRAVRASSIMSRDNSNIVRISVGGGAISVNGNSVANGDSAADVDPKSISGGDMTIGFNGRYVTDVLEHLDAEEVEVSFVSPASPVVIYPVFKERVADTSVVNVIMPMKVER